MQIHEVAENCCKFIDLKTCCIYGGMDKAQQKYQIQKGVDVMVATPGRLLAFVREKQCHLSAVVKLVLGEHKKQN